mgnify:CR=1 FL=1
MGCGFGAKINTVTAPATTTISDSTTGDTNYRSIDVVAEGLGSRIDLDALVYAEACGFDWVGCNEHHFSPYGLMSNCNLIGSIIANRTSKIGLGMFGNLVPLHNPLRIAEELAMADTLSRGRILSGFARGVPREYNVYSVPMAESRARFEEAVEIILKAWTQPKFDHQGKFWSYKDIAIWPRPYQQPHPPLWSTTGSKTQAKLLGEKGYVTLQPAKTGQEYRHEFERRVRETAALDGYSNGLRQYEIAWYGFTGAGASEFSVLRGTWEDLRRHA